MNYFERLKKRMAKSLAGAKIEIIKRTQSGKDIHDRPFVPYSKQYAEYKQENDRSATPVNLTYNFDMLGSIFFDVNQAGGNLSGRLFIPGVVNVANTKTPNAATKAYMHNNGVGKMPKREFFGLSKAQVDKIMNALKTEIMKGGLL